MEKLLLHGKKMRENKKRYSMLNQILEILKQASLWEIIQLILFVLAIPTVILFGCCVASTCEEVENERLNRK